MSYARELVAEDKVENDLKEDTGTTGNSVKSILTKQEVNLHQSEFSK